MDLMSLGGRHALVCGASKGIGRAAALCLAERGATVTALARSKEALEALVPELVAAGAPAAHALVADMDDRAQLDRAVADHLDRHGPMHVLVHNSAGPPAGPMLAASDDEILRAFGRTVLAGQLLVRRLLPGMTSAGYGRVVVVLSTSLREPIANLGVGNTVRGAMGGWAKTLANELPPNVTINNVLPGYTATERLHDLARAAAAKAGKSMDDVERAWGEAVPERRIADPLEIGRVIAFLASPDASYVRGQSIAVDGGRTKAV